MILNIQSVSVGMHMNINNNYQDFHQIQDRN